MSDDGDRGLYDVDSFRADLSGSTDRITINVGPIGRGVGERIQGVDGTVSYRGAAEYGIGRARATVSDDLSLEMLEVGVGRTVGVGGGELVQGYVSVFAGVYYEAGEGAGLAGTINAGGRVRLADGDYRKGINGAIRYEIIDFNDPNIEIVDPAGGSGRAATSPGSGHVPGYGGRFDDGRGLRAGDELSRLDAIAETHSWHQTQVVRPDDWVGVYGHGDGDSRNDNDHRLSSDDWRHSTNNTAPKEDAVSRWNSGSDEGQHDTGTKTNHSVSSPTGYASRGNEDLDGPEAASASRPSSRDVGYDDLGKGHYDAVSNSSLRSLPIVLDLDGSGVEITELSQSTVFMDATGDGLENRTAWAGAGDGVLFYDPDNTGEITEKRQYVFTEWDPTATSDIEALRSVFDSNGDGTFDASDAEFANFKVMVTNADGPMTAQTLTSLGIVSIDLTADATNIELPDGSVITGRTTFTKSDGSTGTVADTMLIAEAQSYRIDEVESVDGSGTRTVTTTGFDADGAIAFVTTSVTTSDGASITNSYDDNGDGVVDRLQTIVTLTNPDGSTVETVTNIAGASAASAILVSQIVTSTSVDGNTVTIDRDSTGGGWFDQTEVRTTHTDDSLTIVVTDKGNGGTVIRSSTETVSADGLTRTDAIDEDGDGAVDLTITHVIIVNVDNSRSETITYTNNDGSVRSSVTETVSTDGQTKTIERDLDGDGDTDTEEELDIAVNANGSTTSMLTVKNGDGSTRNSVTTDQSDDALTKTTAIDQDGDGDTDLTTVEVTTINGDGSRETVTTMTNMDGSVREMQKITLGADKVSSETWIDVNQDGVFQASDLVRDVSVNTSTQERTDVIYDRNPDGSINGTTTTVTSSDGLSSTTDIDADGDTISDTEIATTTVVNGDGSTTETQTVQNQNGTDRSGSVTTTSADGLTVTTASDIDGDGVDDEVAATVRASNPDGSTTTTSTTYAGNGSTVLSETITSESADRRTVATDVDGNGDGHIDQTVAFVEAQDGATTTTVTNLAADGSVTSGTLQSVSADGLTVTTANDINGDSVDDVQTVTQTILDIDGGRTTSVSTTNADGGLRSQSVQNVSDDGLTTTTQTDADGNGVYERQTASGTTLNADGSRTTLNDLNSSDGSLLSQTRTIVSDDGLIVTVDTDADGDGTYDLTSTSMTTLQTDGGTQVASELRDDAGALRNSSTTSTSDDGRDQTTSTDINGDGQSDMSVVRTVADNGVTTATTSELNADGSLQSRSEAVSSANGLLLTDRRDADGDGTFEATRQTSVALNADGSRTTTETHSGNDGSVHARTVTTLSDDGLSSSVTADLDGDGDDDRTTDQSWSISVAGVQTETVSVTAADSSLISSATTTTSADGRSIITETDVDGNGNLDIRLETTVQDDGDIATTSTFYSTGGTEEANRTETISADGFARRVETDRNADGLAEHIHSETGGIRSDGTTWRSVEHYDGRNIALANEEYEVSGDGLSSEARLDIDGDGLFEFTTETETTFQANGDVVTTTTTLNETLDVQSEMTLTTNGNGLTSREIVDFDGDGSTDRITDTTFGAAGGMTEETNEFGGGFQLSRSVETVVSADGWTTTREIDRDGDGRLDARMVSDTDDSRTTTMTYEDLSFLGATEAQASVAQSANGTETAARFDLDGDSDVEITQSTTTTFDASGNAITTFSETLENGKLIYQEVMTDAANGLSSITTIDVDGDGTIDGTKSETTTLNDNGSRDILSETLYADGDLRERSEISVSSDGRLTVETHDYDGNGIADKWRETEVRSDGETIVVERSFNQSGAQNSNFVTTTSSDGLVRTVNRDGVIQTYAKSAVDNGSYTWDNGLTGTAHVLAEHNIDSEGVETWSVTQGTTTTMVRLDEVAKARLFEEAARIYDTVLDRDIDIIEQELLIDFVSEGQLDRAALVTSLIGSGEFTTRYGAINDAEFVGQIYLNSFGRGASLAELDAHLNDLDSGTKTRERLAQDASESAEHLVVGNGHRATNNFDVIMNPAQFERSLDRAYVEAQIRNLVDVVYDRDATNQEVVILSERLLGGQENLDDIAETLLENDGDIFGVGTNPLNGLSTIEFVEQSYVNALGTMPTGVDANTWIDHINAGNITKEQFLSSLSASIEYLQIGSNSHVSSLHSGNSQHDGTNTGTQINGTAEQDELFGYAGNDTLDGNGGSDHLHGGLGDDTLYGNGGNDTYYWSRGDGHDTIRDYASSTSETDHLVFTDVASTDVQLFRINGSQHDLWISITNTAETILVEQQFSDNYVGRGLEVLTFSDGVTWTLQDIHGNTKLEGTASANSLAGKDLYSDNLYGLDGNDALDGNGGDDHFYGGLGDDTLYGNGGSDTYYWSRGDGSDRIEEGANSANPEETDRLILADVISTDISLTRISGASQDMSISISGSSETIRVDDQFSDAYVGRGIEAIEFSDGVVWTLQDIHGNTKLEGTASANSLAGKDMYSDNLYGLDGNDALDGNGGDDHFYGGLGDDTLYGNGGSDTYYWSRGDGSDRINEGSNSSTLELDRLVLSDVASYEVIVDRPTSSSHDMVISISGTSETIYVDDQFADSLVGRGLEYIEFSDGVEWSLSDIHGQSKLEGTAGNDNLAGKNNYNDNIFGYEGNDTLDGNGGDDQLVGGAGNDTIYGDVGNDVYIWQLGDGNDFIDDNGTSFQEVDTLRLQSTSIENIDLSQSGNDLLVTVLSTGEVLTIDDRFASSANSRGIEIVDFDDGVRIEVLADAVAQANVFGTSVSQSLSGWGFIDHIFGYEGNDTLDGNGGSDHLYGGLGEDSLRGDGGNDSYHWSMGDGDDIIYDNKNSLIEIDTLVLTDVASDAVRLSRPTNSNSQLFVEILGSTETLSVTHQFSSAYVGRGLEAIAFSDGVTWTLGDIHANTVLEGTSGNNNFTGQAEFGDNMYGLGGNDTLDGNGGDDHLHGGLGNDKLYGRAGNDTYHWSRGDGDDTITGEAANQAETDRLIFSDVASDEVRLTRPTNSNSTLHIDILGSTETLTVNHQFSSAYVGSGLEAIAFSDGVTWTLNDIHANTVLEGTSSNNSFTGQSAFGDNMYGLGGNDTLNGSGGDDRLYGGTGDDLLKGGAGNDSYYWSRGDGNDYITGESANQAETDRLIFTDVASNEVHLSRPTNGNSTLNISILGSAEELSVNSQFSSAYLGWGFEAIEFSGGVTWTLNDIHANTVLEGTSSNNSFTGQSAFGDNMYGLGGNDTLNGSGGDDRLYGGTGDDLLNGGNDADFFVFEFGDGDDVISDFFISVDTIQLSGTGLGFDDLQISQVGSDTVVEYGSDEITLSSIDATLLTEDQFLFV